LTTFSELPLLPTLRTSLAEQSFKRPTEIQARTLPPLLDGRSLVGVSETGSGKTLAYVLPLLHQLKSLELGGSAVSTPGSPRGLVLVPARELGEQVSKVFKTLTHGTRLRVRTALGGTKKQVARQSVSGKFEVLVATPGRLKQLLEEGGLKLDDVRMLVFDEADSLLDKGFLPVAQGILETCPNSVQLVMFSATLPASLENAVSSLFTSPPVRVQTEGSERIVRTLKTENRRVANRAERFEVLCAVLAEAPTESTMLFVNSREQCETLGHWLDDQGIAYVDYRGEMDRGERRKNLARFRNGEVTVLLTTDLGSRGLDIERVGRIINVHMPQHMANYLHRVGRTARAGRYGLVVNLVTPRDAPLMDKLERKSR
jgi:superfamily II DNA/RNA helicase